MNRIEQRTDSDCLRCCLAYVTGLPYEDVPDFVKHYDVSWITHCQKWLLARRMGLVKLAPTAAPMMPPWMQVICKGTTVRGEERHCVVMGGKGMMDPHPSQKGLKEVEELLLIVHMPMEAQGELLTRLNHIHQIIETKEAEGQDIGPGNTSFKSIRRWANLEIPVE